ncbi:MAG: hypothetical protein ACOZFS_00655 [Thermodesulfobacteriota bacterium]
MKTFFAALLVMAWLAAFALPGLAQSTIPPEDCDLSFDVNALKNKNIEINKTVNKDFDFSFDITVEVVGFPVWAEVEAFKCDHNTENQVAVSGIVPTNNINNSFVSFLGVAQVNQTAGFLNNQGNVLAAGFTGQLGFPLSMVEAAVEKANVDNVLSIAGSVFADNIVSSFNSFTGLAQVNQASGILNNQDNVLALATNLQTGGDVQRPMVAENDTFLSMANTGNVVMVANTVTTATIRNSFNSYTGFSQVNQASGSQNNQANITSISLAR